MRLPIDNFIRFAEIVKVKEDKHVVGVAVQPTLADCTGTIYFTDLQLQEGGVITGYAPSTQGMIASGQTEHWFNAIVRTGATLIIPNLGETSAPLDVSLYPLQSMEAASVSIAQGAGSNRATFLAAASPGDELSLLATTRQCLRNGSPTDKDGFFQYSAAQDSKHPVTLQKKSSARVLLTYRETAEGEVRP
ncbi:hypothetical protein LJC74_05750 [Eubacteriales bacterium OttesenSCG-928-A19]|nr:hypothetical protein [Eubacteriales bacterium OttesenSCG-928-A19]